MLLFLTTATDIGAVRDDDRLEALLTKVAENDKSALSELYGLTRSSVYGFALSILKNAHDAEDVLQSCFVNVWQSAHSYRAKGKPMAWILTVTKNLCYMKLREGKRTEELNPEGAPEAAAPHNTAATAEDKAVLQAALKLLSDDERQIVMLHAVSGLKFREIADLLDMVTATVLSKYNRALKKMRNFLEEEPQ